MTSRSFQSGVAVKGNPVRADPLPGGSSLDYTSLIRDLEAETEALAELVVNLEDREWELPTPAEPWVVRDQIAHLADTDEVCRDQVRGGPRDLRDERSGLPKGMWTELGVVKGRSMDIRDLLAWWTSSAEQCRDELSSVGPRHRIPWGPTEMSAASMASARLMETWAHAVDIRDALGKPVQASPRLRHVVRLGWAAIPYARRAASLTPDVTSFRVEVEGPDGTVAFGPEGARNRITGSMLDFCLRAVQRRSLSECETLVGDGPEAVETLQVLQAFA